MRGFDKGIGVKRMMQIWLGKQIPHNLAGSAVTIGNFDGVHRGHRHILSRLRDQADRLGLLSIVVVFEPQPAEFFAKKTGKPQPFRLTPLREKLQLLADSGCVDAVWMVRFNQIFADCVAEDFVQNIILKQLNTKYLLIGDDFRFGKGRVGDFAMLQANGGFVVEQTPSITAEDGVRISSTVIRQNLQQGRLQDAVALLGHPYALSGRVKHGAKLGRSIGCPTANIHLPQHRYPLSGVFVVEAQGAFGCCGGVASLGVNPTVSRSADLKLEVHLFGFEGNLYGQRMRVRFLHKLRDEQAFDGIEPLRLQIAQDIEEAKQWHQSVAHLSEG